MTMSDPTNYSLSSQQIKETRETAGTFLGRPIPGHEPLHVTLRDVLDKAMRDSGPNSSGPTGDYFLEDPPLTVVQAYEQGKVAGRKEAVEMLEAHKPSRDIGGHFHG